MDETKTKVAPGCGLGRAGRDRRLHVGVGPGHRSHLWELRPSSFGVSFFMLDGPSDG